MALFFIYTLLPLIKTIGLESQRRQARGIDVPVLIYGVTKPVTSRTKPVTEPSDRSVDRKIFRKVHFSCFFDAARTVPRLLAEARQRRSADIPCLRVLGTFQS